MAEGRWPSAAVGVTRWLAAAQEVLADEETVERTSSAPLDRRDELLGRLSARRQQARTLAARGRPIDPGLEPLAQQADDLLHRTPVPLADAAEVITAYEARPAPVCELDAGGRGWPVVRSADPRRLGVAVGVLSACDRREHEGPERRRYAPPCRSTRRGQPS